jgi:hypothetical protein
MSQRGKGFRIESLVAFVSVAPDGDEGLIAFKTETGWMPAVCADKTREDAVEAGVRDLVRGTDFKVRKVRFSTRVDEGLVK